MKRALVFAFVVFGITEMAELGCVKQAEAQEPQTETATASAETVATVDSLPASEEDENWCEDHPLACSVMILTIVPPCPFVLDNGTIVDCFPPEDFSADGNIYW